jgi:hypothetical protein
MGDQSIFSIEIRQSTNTPRENCNWFSFLSISWQKKHRSIESHEVDPCIYLRYTPFYINKSHEVDPWNVSTIPHTCEGRNIILKLIVFFLIFVFWKYIKIIFI